MSPRDKDFGMLRFGDLVESASSSGPWINSQYVNAPGYQYPTQVFVMEKIIRRSGIDYEREVLRSSQMHGYVEYPALGALNLTEPA